jgi:RNA recognition motif-containing protein
MRRQEYFGQYGKIQQINLNKENAYNQQIFSEAADSTSSNKSQISYAAYITYQTP